jgi:hypothetical protein
MRFTIPVESYMKAYHRVQTTKLVMNMQRHIQALD